MTVSSSEVEDLPLRIQSILTNGEHSQPKEMTSIAPSEKETATNWLEKRPWSAAEQAMPVPICGLKAKGYYGDLRRLRHESGLVAIMP